MTVIDTHSIDFVALNHDSSAVRLVVADHLSWAAEPQHLHALQEKLNSYLAFVESGEFNSKYPHLAGKPIEVEVAFQHRPPAHAQAHFLEPVQQRMLAAGFGFRWHVHEFAS